MEQAGKWLQKAADAGDFEATNTYGQLLLTEELGSPDPIAARKYLTKGSERGNCDAMVALASLLIDGSKPNMAEEEDVAVHPMSNVVNDDTKEGREWLQLASEQGGSRNNSLCACRSLTLKRWVLCTQVSSMRCYFTRSHWRKELEGQ